jgi:hypothetical protein
MSHLPDVIALLVASLALVAVFWPKAKDPAHLSKNWRWPKKKEDDTDA